MYVCVCVCVRKKGGKEGGWVGNSSVSFASTLTRKAKSTGVGAWQYGGEKGHNYEGHDSAKGGKGEERGVC